MYSISLDIGTTTIKGILYGEKGQVIKDVSYNTKTISQEIGYMEQMVDDVISFAEKAIVDLIEHATKSDEKVDFISLSSYMHSLICIDSSGKPLTNIILWSDNRSEKYSTEYRKNGKGLELYKLTGTPIHPMSPLYKLMWIKDNMTDVFEKSHKFISIKEYLLHRLVGDYYVDYSIASATGLFNIKTLKWEKKCLDEIGISENQLSIPVPTVKVFQNLLPDAMDRLGLSKDTKIVIGASDGCLANLGSHGLNPGTGVITIGTSGAVRIVTDNPIFDDKARLFCYILDNDFYVTGGALNNGGIVYAWFKELFDFNSSIDSTLAEYDRYDNGLLFLPFINGERAPYWNPKLRGSYMGINHSHTKEDFLYSTIQGINFAIKDVFEILKSKHPDIKTIYANGGFTKSNYWVTRLSSMVGGKIHVLNQGDAACFGCFLLGLKATDKIQSWSQCQEYFDDSKEYNQPENKFDMLMFDIYKKTIDVNTWIHESLSDLQSQNQGRM